MGTSNAHVQLKVQTCSVRLHVCTGQVKVNHNDHIITTNQTNHAAGANLYLVCLADQCH